MARTTSNIDLVPREVLEQLKQLDTQLGQTTENLKGLLTEANEVSNALARSTVEYKDLKELLKALDAIGKKVNDTGKKRRDIIMQIADKQEKLKEADSKEAVELQEVNEQLRRQNNLNKSVAKSNIANANSIDAMRERLKRWTAIANSMGTNTPQFQKMSDAVAKLQAELYKYESAMGNYRRNVGNYSSAFNGLQFNIQQVARELPSLTISASQFFLAISNNLPMLVDELQRARAANAALRKEGQATVPVWKQVLKGIVSWQTALVVAITLLTAFSKEIIGWVKGLFGAKQALIETSEITKAFGNNIARDTAELNVMFQRLKDAKEGTEEYNEARNKIIDNYGEYLKGQREEIRNLENLKDAYDVLTQGIIKNSIQKGLQDANSKAIEEYEKRMDKALNGVEEKFIKKFGEEEGYEKFLTFRVGITSDDEELWKQARAIYGEFMEFEDVAVGTAYASKRVVGNELDDVYKEIMEADKMFRESQDEMLAIQKAFEKVYGIDAGEGFNSLIEKQKELRKEAELMPESTEEEIKLKNQRLKQIDDEIKRLQELGIETDKIKEKINKQAEVLRKLREEESRAKIELDENDAKKLADINKRIVLDDKRSYEDRMAALQQYQDYLIRSLDVRKDYEKEALIESARMELELPDTEEGRKKAKEEVMNQLLLIEQKYDREVEKIAKESAEIQIEIERDRVQKIIEEINKVHAARTKEYSMNESKELSMLAKQFADGLIQREDYEKRKNEMSRKYEEENFRTEMEYLNKIVNLSGISDEDKMKYTEQLGKAELDYRKWLYDQDVKNYEEAAKKENEIDNQKAKIKEDLLMSSFSLAQSLIERDLENRLNELEEESEANQRWAEEEAERIDRLEESGAISKEQADARKAAIDDQAEARERQIEERQREVQRRQAVYQKAMSLAQVAIDTASSIQKTAALMGFPAAIPFIAMAAASGAAQAAAIAATPIPQYAEGTEDHPGGLAIVGDGGKSEMIISGGKVYKTPAVDTLVDLPKHAMVLPDFNAGVEKLPEMPRFEATSTVNVDLSKLEESSIENGKLLRLVLKRMEINAKNEIYARELSRLRPTKL